MYILKPEIRAPQQANCFQKLLAPGKNLVQILK